MKAYIQHVQGNDMTINSFHASKGFDILGYEVIPFEIKELQAPNFEYEKDDILFGGIPIVLDAMTKMGIPQPKEMNYPESLEKFLHRKIEKSTIDFARQEANNENIKPFFLKPVKEKEFKGFVFSSFLDLLQVAHLKKGTEIYISECLEFKSEYRVYFLKNEIVGCKHYHGDSLIFPDRKIIEEIFKSYKEKPVSGSIDVGVTKDGKTVLVEVNDSYSLGNYGIGSILYARMIEERWRELRNDG